VLRDPAQAEEVAQEVWSSLAHGRPVRRGPRLGTSWVFTIAHGGPSIGSAPSRRRGSDHEGRLASVETPYDEVVDEVTGRLERQRCAAA